MNDYRNRIGTHFDNDRWSLYEFTRDSKIPHGSFDKRMKVDGVVFVCLVILITLALLIVNLP